MVSRAWQDLVIGAPRHHDLGVACSTTARIPDAGREAVGSLAQTVGGHPRVARDIVSPA
jgi:hypothetical protein